MEVNYLSFGNIILRIETPEKLLETEKFRAFFCSERPYDFLLTYSFESKNIKPPQNVAYAEYGNKLAFFDGENFLIYYKSAESGSFFALREYTLGSKRINIKLTEKAKGKLWSRLVLDTAGIEELAAQKNGVIFHSSFIENENRGILFTGRCGAGKSTQAELWHEFRKTPIINGDKTYIYLDGEKAFASGLPFSGSSNISYNQTMPLDMVVALGQSSENTAKPLSVRSAFLCLMKSAYVPPYYSDEISLTLAEIAKKVPFCSLFCTPDERAVNTLEIFMKGREKN